MTPVRSPAGLVGVLFLTGSCAVTGIGTPGAADASASAPQNERQIDRSEFRSEWPFEIGVVTLACDAGAVTARTADATYGLNEAALLRGFPAPTPIVRQQRVPPTKPLARIPQDDREKIFPAALGCDRANDPARCRSELGDRYRLTGAELDQIVTEGRERHWPPLEPKRMSLNPVVEAGLRLCQ